MTNLDEILFPVAAFGAVGDGKTNDTHAVQAAIDAAHGLGGGEVVFFAGRFLLGPVRTYADVMLDGAGAEIVATHDADMLTACSGADAIPAARAYRMNVFYCDDEQ